MVFGVSLAGKALTLLMLVIRLEMFKWKPARVAVEEERRPKRRHVLSPGHVKVGQHLYPLPFPSLHTAIAHSPQSLKYKV